MLWCIQQLELSIESGKLTDKRVADVKKAIKHLRNPQTPLVKIRQIMRTNFGDYRAKMAAEEKAAKLDLTKVKLIEGDTSCKGDKVTFIKKAASKTGAKDPTQKSEFKFSFNVGTWFAFLHSDKMEKLEEEILNLKRQLADKDEEINTLKTKLRAYQVEDGVSVSTGLNLPEMEREPNLTNKDIAKYSRQIILPEFRVRSQKKLKVHTELFWTCINPFGLNP